jgi:lysophospholipase L1-like esterase
MSVTVWNRVKTDFHGRSVYGAMTKQAIIILCITVFMAGMAIGHFKPFPIRNVFTRPAPAPEHSPTEWVSWKLRQSLFATFAPTTKIVMVGASLIENAEWSDVFPGVSIANRGISGDTAEGVLARIDQISVLQPGKVFLMIGCNDLNAGHSVDRIMLAYTEIIRRLKSRGISVFVQSTLFTGKELGINGDVEKLNAALEQFCKDQLCTFIDLNTVICPEGFLRESLTFDGIHLNGAGYMLWRDVIRPYL